MKRREMEKQDWGEVMIRIGKDRIEEQYIV